ncbi:hypothetical protein FKM82_024882 [Ascaphus truei]
MHGIVIHTVTIDPAAVLAVFGRKLFIIHYCLYNNTPSASGPSPPCTVPIPSFLQIKWGKIRSILDGDGFRSACRQQAINRTQCQAVVAKANKILSCIKNGMDGR